MEDYRENYIPLPATSELGNLKMSNNSDPLDYGKAEAHIKDSQSYIDDIAREMYDRIDAKND